MNPTGIDPQSVLDFYQVFLTLLVWMLASLAGIGILVSVMLNFLECHPVALGRKHTLPTFRDGQGIA